MDEKKDAWLTRDEVWRGVAEPLLADPVAREAYEFSWEGDRGLCLYLSDKGDDGPVVDLQPCPYTSSIILYCNISSPHDDWSISCYPLPEGMAEGDWPDYVKGDVECIEGARRATERVRDLIYGDPLNLMPKADLLAMVRGILWIAAGATSSRARSTGEPWRVGRNLDMEDFLATRPDLDPDDFLVKIPRYVVDVESRRPESLTRSFANLEFRLNMPG